VEIPKCGCGSPSTSYWLIHDLYLRAYCDVHTRMAKEIVGSDMEQLSFDEYMIHGMMEE
jgi:hypothetical protein